MLKSPLNRNSPLSAMLPSAAIEVEGSLPHGEGFQALLLSTNLRGFGGADDEKLDFELYWQHPTSRRVRKERLPAIETLQRYGKH